jgi:RsiW-degrading membrane proteinase PrsW (M82 family)
MIQKKVLVKTLLLAWSLLLVILAFEFMMLPKLWMYSLQFVGFLFVVSIVVVGLLWGMFRN